MRTTWESEVQLRAGMLEIQDILEKKVGPLQGNFVTPYLLIASHNALPWTVLLSFFIPRMIIAQLDGSGGLDLPLYLLLFLLLVPRFFLVRFSVAAPLGLTLTPVSQRRRRGKQIRSPSLEWWEPAGSGVTSNVHTGSP